MFSDAELAALESEVRIQLIQMTPDELSGKKLYRDVGEALRHPPRPSLSQLPGATDAIVAFRNGERGSALSWARGFLVEFLSDVRRSICAGHKRGRGSKPQTVTARSAAMGLASWLGATFMISNPVAIALATFVVLVISSAALSAFCTMTEDDVRKSLSAGSNNAGR